MFKCFNSGRVARLLPVEGVHSVQGQSSGRRNIETATRPPGTSSYPSLPTGKGVGDLLSRAVQVLRESSVGDASNATYDVGFNQFGLFLVVARIAVAGLLVPELLAVICKFAAYLFMFRGLAPNTIRSYIQGVDHHLKMANIISGTVWHPALNQTLRGIDRQASFETALINRAKLPFSLSLILLARSNVLGNAESFELYSVFAALCMGFMFLFRIYRMHVGGGKVVRREKCTLVSDNVLLWWGTTSYPSTSGFIPSTPPDYISVYLPRSKGDPFGKGATRFFPKQKGGEFCLVTIIYIHTTCRIKTGGLFFRRP